MGLFGMTQYIGHVGGDIFLNFALSGIIQIPGNFLAWWTMNAIGRRITLVASNVVAGIAGILLIFVGDGESIFIIILLKKRVSNQNNLKLNFYFADYEWLRLIFACFGIVGMSVSFTTVYLYSGELFPTVIRNIGVGTSSMCARIGSMMAPFVVSLVCITIFIAMKINLTLFLIIMQFFHFRVQLGPGCHPLFLEYYH